MSELHDLIAPDLRVLFIGYNPSLTSAEVGHHFAGRNNAFWRVLYDAGLTPRRMQAAEDEELLELGMGLTNIVERPTRAASELSRSEYQAGAVVLREKLLRYRPKVACYVGIGVYKAFAGVKKCHVGLQTQSVVESVLDFVAPSTSGLNRMPYLEQLGIYKQLADLLR